MNNPPSPEYHSLSDVQPTTSSLTFKANGSEVVDDSDEPEIVSDLLPSVSSNNGSMNFLPSHLLSSTNTGAPPSRWRRRRGHKGHTQSVSAPAVVGPHGNEWDDVHIDREAVTEKRTKKEDGSQILNILDFYRARAPDVPISDSQNDSQAMQAIEERVSTVLSLWQKCNHNSVTLYQHLHSLLIHELMICPEYLISPDCRVLQDLDMYMVHCTSSSIVVRLAESQGWRRRLLMISTALGLSGDSRILTALNEDEKNISNIVKQVLTSSDEKSVLKQLKGDQAELFMNLIQYVLDKGLWHQVNDATARSEAYRMLSKLSQNCDILPSSLSVQGITLLESEAVSGGGFADIFRGSYNGKPVALKRLRVFQTNQERQKVHRMFCKEALVWQHLKHPFVLPFLGVDSETFSPLLCMVSPWLPHGTILNYAEHMGPSNVDLYKFVTQIAEGVDYLHSQKVIHGDIRATNILIDDNWNAVLADFGLAAFAEATIATHSTAHRGSTRWMAPELHDPESFGLLRFARSRATDVYAFACTCLEVYTGKLPFHNVANDTAIIFRVVAGSRPGRPSDGSGRLITDDLWELIQSCWDQEHAKRPGMGDVVELLRIHTPSNNPHTSRVSYLRY